MRKLHRLVRRKPRWRWSHGFNDWQWMPAIGAWFHPSNTPGHDYYCRGDRMFHGSYGLVKDDIVYHGSYTGDWHGGIQTRDFLEALDWLWAADGKDNYAWSKDS